MSMSRRLWFLVHAAAGAVLCGALAVPSQDELRNALAPHSHVVAVRVDPDGVEGAAAEVVEKVPQVPEVQPARQRRAATGGSNGEASQLMVEERNVHTKASVKHSSNGSKAKKWGDDEEEDDVDIDMLSPEEAEQLAHERAVKAWAILRNDTVDDLATEDAKLQQEAQRYLEDQAQGKKAPSKATALQVVNDTKVQPPAVSEAIDEASLDEEAEQEIERARAVEAWSLVHPNATSDLELEGARLRDELRHFQQQATAAQATAKDRATLAKVHLEIERLQSELGKVQAVESLWAWIFKHDDIWPDWAHTEKHAEDMGFRFFHAGSRREWMILALTVVASLTVEYVFLRNLPDTRKGHLIVLGLGMLLGLLYNVHILVSMGRSKALQWTMGYLLEWMLSMDNLFLFTVMVKFYGTPQSQIRKALCVGLVGSALLKMVSFIVLSMLLSIFEWIRIPFGALLIWSCIGSLREVAQGDGDSSESETLEGQRNTEDLLVFKCLKRCFGSRLKNGFDENGPNMFSWDEHGRLQATMLFVLVCHLEVMDTVFAVDSVSAKIAQIPDQYISYSSSVIALFGLRAMFFVVADLVKTFWLLKFGLCFIIMFVGLQMILGSELHLSEGTVCILIFSVFVISILGSLTPGCQRRRGEDDEAEEEKGSETRLPRSTRGLRKSTSSLSCRSPPSPGSPRSPTLRQATQRNEGAQAATDETIADAA